VLAQQRNGRRVLLIVDEAQNLSSKRSKSCACCPTSLSARRWRCRASCSGNRSFG
jgi:hypothetical protein